MTDHILGAFLKRQAEEGKALAQASDILRVASRVGHLTSVAGCDSKVLLRRVASVNHRF